MNCKQGDLAIVVKTAPDMSHHLGKIVRCVSLEIIHGVPAWCVEPEFEDALAAEDEALRPIRDQPGEDEMLRIASKPVKETA